MAMYRETPCKYYVAFGECSKGREAHQIGYCQRCNKYVPRVKTKTKNRKKEKLEEIRRKEDQYD